MLILEIFGERARSHEGKLQVELARLQYLSTRLVRRWSHLERQRGGIGTRGGPGEAQIELDRRMIGERIKAIKKQLEQGQAAAQHAAPRARAQPDLPRLAGRLHQRRQVDALQRPGQGRGLCRRPAVRDPRHHHAPAAPRATIERGVALSDTVGFIRDLPHTLIEAFQATLQEAADADLLLHVVDAASPDLAEQMREVERVLDEIGAGEVEQVVVFNKIDRLDETERPRALADSVELPSGRRVPRRVRQRASAARAWTRCASASPTWRCAIREPAA